MVSYLFRALPGAEVDVMVTRTSLWRHSGALIWIAFLLPSGAWLTQLTVSFMLSSYACFPGQLILLHGISVATALVAGVGVWCAWKIWRISRQESARGTEGQVLLSFTAFLMALLILLVILVGELSNFFLLPCR